MDWWAEMQAYGAQVDGEKDLKEMKDHGNAPSSSLLQYGIPNLNGFALAWVSG